ncbi:hypothetical protein [Hymenobacter arizonensis]|uniref:Uncharacterized protein n=1 Tax=Hymenobacter arizonensis TaxID=1227077 RepID=A0A1I5Z315_HYMAR|nr:hypothetical protein [Hymenobacter arizonensis]SFQ50876.1 hypothetical protein SAMN04515668_2662 [Hymenobacter arizonensis]
MHLLCEVLAYTLGYWLYSHLRTRAADPIRSAHRQWIFVGAAAGALLGSRLLVKFIKPTIALPGLGHTAIQWACVAGLGYYVWLSGQQLFIAKFLPKRQ